MQVTLSCFAPSFFHPHPDSLSTKERDEWLVSGAIAKHSGFTESSVDNSPLLRRGAGGEDEKQTVISTNNFKTASKGNLKII